MDFEKMTDAEATEALVAQLEGKSLEQREERLREAGRQGCIASVQSAVQRELARRDRERHAAARESEKDRLVDLALGGVQAPAFGDAAQQIMDDHEEAGGKR